MTWFDAFLMWLKCFWCELTRFWHELTCFLTWIVIFLTLTLLQNSSVMVFSCYYGIPLSLWKTIFIMESHYHYGKPYLLWNSIIIMEFHCHYGNVTKRVIMRLNFEELTWQKRRTNKKQLLRLLERARSQKVSAPFQGPPHTYWRG